jgi:hypothetical protein
MKTAATCILAIGISGCLHLTTDLPDSTYADLDAEMKKPSPNFRGVVDQLSVKRIAAPDRSQTEIFLIEVCKQQNDANFDCERRLTRNWLEFDCQKLPHCSRRLEIALNSWCQANSTFLPDNLDSAAGLLEEYNSIAPPYGNDSAACSSFKIKAHAAIARIIEIDRIARQRKMKLAEDDYQNRQLKERSKECSVAVAKLDSCQLRAAIMNAQVDILQLEENRIKFLGKSLQSGLPPQQVKEAEKGIFEAKHRFQDFIKKCKQRLALNQKSISSKANAELNLACQLFPNDSGKWNLRVDTSEFFYNGLEQHCGTEYQFSPSWHLLSH